MSKQAKEFDWRRDFFGRLDKSGVESCLYDYPGFLNDESIPFDAKKAMAALLCAYENTRASETGVLCMDLDTLSRIAGMRKMNFKLSVKTLERLGLVKYSIGEKREKGKKAGVASSFKVNFEALQTLSEQASGEAGPALHYITSNSNIFNNNLFKNISVNDIAMHPSALQNISSNLTGINNKLSDNISEQLSTEHLSIEQPNKKHDIPVNDIAKHQSALHDISVNLTGINEKSLNENTEDDIAQHPNAVQDMSSEDLIDDKLKSNEELMKSIRAFNMLQPALAGCHEEFEEVEEELPF